MIMEKIKAFFGKVGAVYEWMADIIADYPKSALAIIIVLFVLALV